MLNLCISNGKETFDALDLKQTKVEFLICDKRW